MLENTYHAGKYIPCWTIHIMLENTYHAGKSIPGKRAVMYLWLDLSILRLYMILIFNLELFRHTMLENTYHAGQYIPCWTIHTMLDNAYHAGQWIPCYVNEMKNQIFHTVGTIPN
jgi:hypothetical protein